MAKDYGHKETDKIIAGLEKKLSKTYKDASDVMQQKITDYMAKFGKKDSIHKADVSSGKWTQAEYEEWRKNQLLYEKGMQEKLDTLAEDLHNVDKIAMQMVKDKQVDVYALNANYGTYEVENGIGVDTSFSLYDHATVERLMKDDPELLPAPSKKKQAEIDAKDIKWNKEKLRSTFTSSVLAGDSIPDMAKRISSVADMDKRAAIRNARTMCTGAENAGRIDSYKRASNMGINLEQEWLAALDGRTRDSHRSLDGEKIKIGGVFSNGCRFPGDPTGPAWEVYNCRCTLIAVVEGVDPGAYDKTPTLQMKLGNKDISYEAWQGQKKDAYAHYGGDGLAALLNTNHYPHSASYWKQKKSVQKFLADTGMSEEEFDKHIADYNADFYKWQEKKSTKESQVVPSQRPEIKSNILVSGDISNSSKIEIKEVKFLMHEQGEIEINKNYDIIDNLSKLNYKDPDTGSAKDTFYKIISKDRGKLDALTYLDEYISGKRQNSELDSFFGKIRDYIKNADNPFRRKAVKNSPGTVIANRLKKKKIDYLEPEKYEQVPDEDAIIKFIAGGDKTSGSCSSAALAYIANKAGLKVRDFRGGESLRYFSLRGSKEEFKKFDDVEVKSIKDTTSSVLSALKRIKSNKEYMLNAGRHSAIVKKDNNGKLYYLELQSDWKNGWLQFLDGNEEITLISRFHTEENNLEKATLIDVDSLAGSEEFKKIAGFINTEESKQKKGAGGYER